MFEILEAFKEQTGHDIGENISFLEMNKTKKKIKTSDSISTKILKNGDNQQ